MILHPCISCSYHKNCSREHKLKKQLKGTGILTCSFSCKKKWKDFSPGTRVEISFVVHDYNYEDHINIPGTIMRRSNKHKHKILVWLDHPVRDEIVRVNLPQNRLTLLNEPSVKICKECGKPEGKENSEGWYCNVCNPEREYEEIFNGDTGIRAYISKEELERRRAKQQKRLQQVPDTITITQITAQILSQ